MATPYLPEGRPASTEYKLISTAQRKEFVDEVNKLLAQGWQLHGTTLLEGGIFTQAFTLHHERIPSDVEANEKW